VLCLLPGSRRSELRQLLPVFAATVERLRERHPTLTTVLPTVPTIAAQAREAVQAWPNPPEIIIERSAGLAAMAGADAALAASGTVTLELALLRTPFVACYRANPLTVAVVRSLLRVPYVTLVNLVLGRAVVPELLQQRCRPEIMAAELDRLLTSPEAVSAQLAGFAELSDRLAVDTPPSERAASIIADIVLEREAAGLGSA
jgi:lipid-A-disaccharide synthase